MTGPDERPAFARFEALLGGGTYTFCLTVGATRELERRLGRGCGEIVTRFATQTWGQDDIAETIRLGLEGGGEVSPVAARALIDRYVLARPLTEHFALAVDILAARMHGVPDTGRAGPEPDDAPRAPGDFADIYQAAAAAGLKPADLATMSFEDVFHHLKGYARAQGAKDKPEIPDEQVAEFEADAAHDAALARNPPKDA